MKITRSFTKTYQITQFNPIVSSVTIESETTQKSLIKDSKLLDEVCRKEVYDTIREEVERLNPKIETKKKLNPEILTHPNIPTPLHGVAPRAIKGTTWWNKKRQEVYAQTDNNCTVCGVYKTEAKDKKWMEAHESYDINYKKGITKVSRYDGLCHYCHNFIHDNRLKILFTKGKISLDKITGILEHGVSILENNNLTIKENTAKTCDELGIKYNCNIKATPKSKIKWSKWHLYFEGKKHPSLFKNSKEHKAFYNDK